MEQNSILKGNHQYKDLLKHLDKFIEKYVLCKGCNYPEIKMFIEGKDGLKSKCNSCGKSNDHDSKSKAGKVFVSELKQGKAQVEDIVNKDKKRDQEESEEEEEKIVVKDEKKKKDKDKKDKKKKKDKDGNDSDKSVSEADEEVTYKSRRIGKYSHLD